MRYMDNKSGLWEVVRNTDEKDDQERIFMLPCDQEIGGVYRALPISYWHWCYSIGPLEKPRGFYNTRQQAMDARERELARIQIDQTF